MVDTDLSKVERKRPKVAVSLSLDKGNIEFLKKDIEKQGEGMTLSGVFDYWLRKFVKAIKKRRGEEKEENEIT